MTTPTPEPAVRERPIIFSGEMVRAILDGHKTQTRRVIKHPERHGCPTGDCPHECQWQCDEAMNSLSITNDCPYGHPGTKLWVRESWWMHDDAAAFDASDANCTDADGNRVLVNWDASMDEDSRRIGREYGCRKRSPMFMPRWASRITLEVTGVRVERVQSISEEDAIAEGLRHTGDRIQDGARCSGATSVRGVYAALWDRINGKKHPWSSNPWVWVITFRSLR